MRKTYVWSDYGIFFTSAEILENISTESEFVFCYWNKNISVDIQIIPIAEEPIEDIKLLSKQVALDMKLVNIQGISVIPSVPQSNYVLAYAEEANRKVPVYVAAVFNSERNIVYEITVHCYNDNEIEGEQITKSLGLLKLKPNTPSL